MSHNHHAHTEASIVNVRRFEGLSQNDLTCAEREEFKQLSLKCYGKTSFYQKLLKGIPKVQTRTLTQTVPAHEVTAEDGTVTQVEESKQERQVAIRHGHGVVMAVTRMDLATVYVRMLEISKIIDDALAAEEARKAQIIADEKSDSIHDAMAGSAL